MSPQMKTKVSAKTRHALLFYV
uniref:Uncharacterized protein n=1 Tax=Anguilla anguilla TaxID=7936 RepID=A0A0E9SHQ8_ANGAN